jgi:hypothetical protein
VYLVRLMYGSQSRDLSYDQIEQIVAGARVFNAARDITGVLLMGDGRFLQCLEGGRAAVSDLYHHRILRDPRHTDVQLISLTTIPSRDFSGWAMGLINDTKALRLAIRQFTPASTFDPSQMPADNALALARYLGRVGHLPSST